MKPWLKCLAFLPFLCFAPGTRADNPTYYEFHPQSIMSLGLGFSVADLTEPKAPCVLYTRHPLESGSLSTSASIRMVSNTQELRDALSVDSSVDVSYLMFKGSASFSFSQESLFSASDVNLVLKFSNEYARIGMQDQHLTQRAQGLLDRGDLGTFKSECGTRLVLIEHRGATVAAIITLHNVDSSSKAKYAGSLSAGINIGAFTGDMKASISGEMDRAVRDRRISVQVVSTGGEGFGALSSLVSQDAQGNNVFGGLQKDLGDYIKTFNNENAAPIGFSVGPMLGLSESENDLWSLEKERRLGILVDEYRRDMASQIAIASILSGNDARSDVYSQTQLHDLQELTGPLDAFLDRLSQIHSACKKATTSTLSICVLPSNKPTIPVYLKPVAPLTGQWFVNIDGTNWSPLKSRTIFDDPSGGSLMERVKRRVPNAKSASIMFSVNGRIVDEQLVINDAYPLPVGTVRVFYPNKTAGDTLLPGDGKMTLAIGPANNVDVNPLRLAWATASNYRCLPIENHLPGMLRIFVNVRDEFGQTAPFEIATFVYTKAGDSQAGGPVLSLWLPIHDVQYLLKFDEKMTCHDSREFYMSTEADAAFKSAVDAGGIQIYPSNMSPEWYSIVERQVREAAPH